jgi:hypothetical protein
VGTAGAELLDVGIEFPASQFSVNCAWAVVNTAETMMENMMPIVRFME